MSRFLAVAADNRINLLFFLLFLFLSPSCLLLLVPRLGDSGEGGGLGWPEVSLWGNHHVLGCHTYGSFESGWRQVSAPVGPIFYCL